jgi:hypothetical protein
MTAAVCPQPWRHLAAGAILAAALAVFPAAAPVGPAFAQSVEQLRKSDQPLEINAEDGFE